MRQNIAICSQINAADPVKDHYEMFVEYKIKHMLNYVLNLKETEKDMRDDINKPISGL